MTSASGRREVRFMHAAPLGVPVGLGWGCALPDRKGILTESGPEGCHTLGESRQNL